MNAGPMDAADQHSARWVEMYPFGASHFSYHRSAALMRLTRLLEHATVATIVRVSCRSAFHVVIRVEHSSLPFCELRVRNAP
jgi:hypothetical protein